LRGWLFGWTAAMMALVCALALAADRGRKQPRDVADAALNTLSAAQAAGADVVPTRPKLDSAAR
jgi:hypothetical protein